MMRPSSSSARSRPRVPLAVGAAALLSGCAAGPSGGTALPTPLSDAEWRALAAPRPAPLPGAARLAVADIDLLGEPPWPAPAALPAGLGLTELVIAGLLRRPDVRVVERRRFAAAVEAERSGVPRPAGTPPAGVSPGAELTAAVAWVPLGAAGATLEVRLTETATGRVAATRRATLQADAEPVGLARAIVGTLLGALAELGRLPAWDDPVPGAAPAGYARSDVPSEALADFLSGLAAEERWQWEAARVAYQRAAGAPGFFEAGAALARAARLRLGGSLGES